VAAEIFGEIGSRDIVVDDIIAGVSNQGRDVMVVFTVENKNLEPARAVAELIAQRYPGARVEVTEQLARLRVVGIGMRAHSGVAARLFKAIAAENINIENISTSEIVISLLVPETDGDRALQAVHSAFALDREPEEDEDARR